MYIDFNLFENHKMIFFAFDETFATQFAYFGRKSASVYFEIVSQFLAVIGYIEAVASAGFGIHSKVGQKLFSCGTH